MHLSTRPEQVAIQRLDARATPSSFVGSSSTTPASRPDVRNYYDTLTTLPDSPADYSYSSSAEYTYGSSPEDYDQSERTVTRAQPYAETDDYDLIANVVGPATRSSTPAPAPIRTTQNTKSSTLAFGRSPTKSSAATTQTVKVTKSTSTTTRTTPTPTTTTQPPTTTTTKVARYCHEMIAN